MKYFYISMAVMLAYLIVYCVACYHVYLRPGTERAGRTSRPVSRCHTYCAPAFLFSSTVKPGGINPVRGKEPQRKRLEEK